MLNLSTLKKAADLTLMLDAKGIVLDAQEGTPVFHLNKALGISPFFYINGRNEVVLPEIAQGVGDAVSPGSNSVASDIGNDHNLVMDQVVGTISEAVKEHVRYARSVVMADAIAFSDKVRNLMSKIQPSSVTSFNVECKCIPSILKNAEFLDLVNKFSSGSGHEPKLPSCIPNMNPEEVMSLLKTGGSKLEKDIGAWLNSIGLDKVEYVWNQVFRSTDQTVGTLKDYYGLVFDKDQGANFSALIFLFSLKLQDFIPEGVNLQASVFESLMADLRGQTANRIKHIVEEYDSDYKKGIMIDKVVDTTVYVYEDVYNKWLENGGTVDALFGRVVTKDNTYTADEITAKGSTYLKAFSDYVSLRQVADSNQKHILVKDCIRSVFLDMYSNAEFNVASGQEGAPAPIALNEKLNEMVDNLNYNDIENMDLTCLNIVHAILYPKTAAFDLLKAINSAMAVNKGMDIREAATLAVIEYVSSFVFAQLKLVGLSAKA